MGGIVGQLDYEEGSGGSDPPVDSARYARAALSQEASRPSNIFCDFCSNNLDGMERSALLRVLDAGSR